jgi:hypothetical protein
MTGDRRRELHTEFHEIVSTVVYNISVCIDRQMDHTQPVNRILKTDLFSLQNPETQTQIHYKINLFGWLPGLFCVHQIVA